MKNQLILGLLYFFLAGFAVRAQPKQAADQVTDNTAKVSFEMDRQPETPWEEMRRHLNVVYFLYKDPNLIKGYDLDSGAWLPDILLKAEPSAFHVDSDGIFVAFGAELATYDLSGENESIIGDFTNEISWIQSRGDWLYFHYLYYYTIYDKSQDAEIQTGYYGTGFFSGAITADAIFSFDGCIPPVICRLDLDADGKLGTLVRDSYRNFFPSGTTTFASPDPNLVYTNTGLVYSAADLGYLYSLGGAIGDLGFDGQDPIVMRGKTFYRYENYKETARLTAVAAPFRFVLHHGDIVYFYGSLFAPTPRINVRRVSLTQMAPALPGPAVPAEGLAYTPDDVAIDADGILYLLSGVNHSLFRWQAGNGYLPSIPLLGEADDLTYDAANHRLFIGYDSGKINTIDLSGPLIETSFGNTVSINCGMTMVGDYLLVCDEAGSYEPSFFTFGNEGIYTDWALDLEKNDAYVWNASHQRVFFTDDGSFGEVAEVVGLAVDGSGRFGSSIANTISSEQVNPVLLSPDDQKVLTGSGDLFYAADLSPAGVLNTDHFVRGLWLADAIYTLRPTPTVGKGTSYLLDSWSPDGANLRSTMMLNSQVTPWLLHDGSNPIIVTVAAEGPQFLTGTTCELTGGITGRAPEWPNRSILDLLNECPIQ